MGGILGSLYDFLDTDWILPANCWEYSQVVKGNKSTSKTPFPVRRLAMEMRGYIGTLTEEHPGPMFVTTDVEAKTREPIAAKSKRTNRKKRRREEDYEEDYRYDD